MDLNAPVTSQSCAQHTRFIIAVTEELSGENVKEKTLNTKNF